MLCSWLAGILAHPWFQTNLPQEALAMNDGLLRLPRLCAQSEQDIWKIVEVARRRVQKQQQEQLASA